MSKEHVQKLKLITSKPSETEQYIARVATHMTDKLGGPKLLAEGLLLRGTTLMHELGIEASTNNEAMRRWVRQEFEALGHEDWVSSVSTVANAMLDRLTQRSWHIRAYLERLRREQEEWDE